MLCPERFILVESVDIQRPMELLKGKWYKNDSELLRRRREKRGKFVFLKKSCTSQAFSFHFPSKLQKFGNKSISCIQGFMNCPEKALRHLQKHPNGLLHKSHWGISCYVLRHANYALWENVLVTNLHWVTGFLLARIGSKKYWIIF